MLRKKPIHQAHGTDAGENSARRRRWIHEVKFDGWQVHVEDGEATIFSKNGADLTRRFRALKPLIDHIPARSAIIDCELVACDEAGLPCFRTLMDHAKNNVPLCLWAFDLLCTSTGSGSRPCRSPIAKKGWPSSSWRPIRTPAVLRHVRRPDQAARNLR